LNAHVADAGGGGKKLHHFFIWFKPVYSAFIESQLTISLICLFQISFFCQIQNGVNGLFL